MAGDSLGALVEIARRRARAALDRVVAGERAHASAREATERERAARDAFEAGLPERRAGRMGRLLAGAPASPLRLARVSLQYAIEQEDLREWDRRVRELERAEAIAARELAELRDRARVAMTRESKLAAASERLAAGARLAEESLSELESEP